MRRVIVVRLSMRVACPFVFMALAGCGGSHLSVDEPADFGADVVVRSMVVAQQKCNAVGVPDLYECAEVPPSPAGERLAARVALDMYQVFQQSCYETAGAGRCEALVDAAYQKTKAQELRR